MPRIWPIADIKTGRTILLNGLMYFLCLPLGGLMVRVAWAGFMDGSEIQGKVTIPCATYSFFFIYDSDTWWT
jgi:hypothetical protein